MIGVDYHTGLQVCSTLQPVRSFLAYAMNTIASIGSGGWALPVSDGSFYDGENFRDQLPDGDTEAEGGTEVNGSDAVGGDTAVSGDGADGQVSGATAPGGQAAQSGGPTAQAGTDGAASSGSGTAAAAPGSGSNDSSDGAAAEQTVEEAMKELFGSSLVAYSDSTGQYEVLDTASLAQGQQVRVADVLAHRNSADSGADHSFSVAWGINRSLDTAERQGFVLIALAAGAGMIVLIALFCKIRRRKK